VVLALLYLFAGEMKLALPVATLAKFAPLPGLFLKFIGVAEVAGALGLILPGVLRVRQGLTALVPVVVGCLAALVARGRMSSGAMEVAHA
jgi:hypothetical protein